MIELKNDELVFSFPEVHKKAVLRINFQRTLRIPDDEQVHSLPAGLGKFPMEHVDDFTQSIPESWMEHGGVMLPMYQSEAMWLSLRSRNEYPFVVKIAAGKINAVTGEPWKDGINRDPQDYLQIPNQPWLDGFCVKKGVIRQFVAMPLGEGYTAEEQITGKAEFGGLQISVHPMKREVYEKYEAEERAREEAYRREEEERRRIEVQKYAALFDQSCSAREALSDQYSNLRGAQQRLIDLEKLVLVEMKEGGGDAQMLMRERHRLMEDVAHLSHAVRDSEMMLEKINEQIEEMSWSIGHLLPCVMEEVHLSCCSAPDAGMGLAPGGKMRQEIYEDEYKLDEWDHDVRSRCFVHLANSVSWCEITGALPPQEPPTAFHYAQAGLPWFDYYDDAPALQGADVLKKLKSVKQMAMDNGDQLGLQDDSVAVEAPVEVGPKKRSSRKKFRIREC